MRVKMRRTFYMSDSNINIDLELVSKLENEIVMKVRNAMNNPGCSDQDIVKLIRKTLEERVKCKY